MRINTGKFGVSAELTHAGFVLPKGYPEAVTPDYLAFQLWAVPAHITGWMGTSLATSSLLKAVGLANSAEGAAAAGAAIKWIAKDGIGAAGRSLVIPGGHQLWRAWIHLLLCMSGPISLRGPP